MEALSMGDIEEKKRKNRGISKHEEERFSKTKFNRVSRQIHQDCNGFVQTESENVQQSQIKVRSESNQNPRVSSQVLNQRSTTKGRRICNKPKRLGFGQLPENPRTRKEDEAESKP